MLWVRAIFDRAFEINYDGFEEHVGSYMIVLTSNIGIDSVWITTL